MVCVKIFSEKYAFTKSIKFSWLELWENAPKERLVVKKFGWPEPIRIWKKEKKDKREEQKEREKKKRIVQLKDHVAPWNNAEANWFDSSKWERKMEKDQGRKKLQQEKIKEMKRSCNKKIEDVRKE